MEQGWNAKVVLETSKTKRYLDKCSYTRKPNEILWVTNNIISIGGSKYLGGGQNLQMEFHKELTSFNYGNSFVNIKHHSLGVLVHSINRSIEPNVATQFGYNNIHTKKYQ